MFEVKIYENDPLLEKEKIFQNMTNRERDRDYLNIFLNKKSVISDIYKEQKILERKKKKGCNF